MPVEELSDNICFVFFAYIAAFLPWSFLAAKDFISPRWRTIKDTRNAGIYTAAFSVIPACYVLAYMIVQGLSTDYKEMCAALVALVFSCLVFLRTLWGLWQLHYFRQWAINSITALNLMGVTYAPLSSSAKHKTDIHHIADHLLVNDTIVDNQLAHGEARCFIKYGNLTLNGAKDKEPHLFKYLHSVWLVLHIVFRWCYDYVTHIFCDAPHPKIELAPFKPENVWLNWSVAFAAQGLGGWLRDFAVARDPENEPGYANATSRERFERRGQHFGLKLVSSAWLQFWCENGLSQDGSKTSPFHWYGLWNEDSFMKDGLIVKSELLGKAMESGIALPFGASHDIAARKDAEHAKEKRPGYHAYRRKLEQVVNEVPVLDEFEEKVEEFGIEELEWLTILLHLGTIATGRREELSEKMNIRTTEQERAHDAKDDTNNFQALKNLRTQIYFRDPSRSTARSDAGLRATPQLFQCVSVRIPLPSKVFLSVYNRHVAKIGEMIDAWMSLFCGDQMAFMLQLNGSNFWEEVCFLGHVNSLDEEKLASVSSDESKATQSIHAEIEKRRFYYNLVNEANRYDSCDHFITFMGYRMETVRSILGSWVVHNQDNPKSEAAFRPLIENLDEVSVNLGPELSQVLLTDMMDFNLSHRGVQTRFLWELQQGLAKEGEAESPPGPGSVRVIILCILSFPSICVEREEEGRKAVTCEVVNSSVLMKFRDEDDGRRSFPQVKIYAKGGPQPVEVVGTFSEKEGEDGILIVKLCLRGSEEVKRFRWTMWRDAFLGRLRGLKEWQEDHGIQSAGLNLTDGEMRATLENVELPTGEKLVCWTGWKPFRFDFMRFELERDGILKEQSVVGEECAHHLLTVHLESPTEQEKQRSSELLAWQGKVSLYCWLDSLSHMRIKTVKYRKASGVTLRQAYLIVEQAFVGVASSTRVTGDRDRPNLLLRNAEECLKNEDDWERAAALLEIAATVHGSEEALDRCVSVLIEQSEQGWTAIRILSLIERFVAHFYSVDMDQARSQIMSTTKAENFLLPTCLKVMERFGDDHLTCGRLSTLFAHGWLIDQVRFRKKTLAALQTLYSMRRDIRVLETLSQVLYHKFSSLSTETELQRNIEHLTGRRSPTTESCASLTAKLNRDNLWACKAFTRESVRNLKGKQRNAANLGLFDVQLATLTAWECVSTDRVYQGAVELYEEVVESGEFRPAVMAIISWVTLLLESRDSQHEKNLEELICFVIKHSDKHRRATLLVLAEALRRGSKNKARNNEKARKVYLSAIEGGDNNARNLLGVMLQHGAEGVERDVVEAEKQFRRSIQIGDADAMNKLGFMLQNGAEGLAPNEVEAEKWYREASKRGNVRAMYNLGIMLQHGAEGVSQDAVEAEKLYRRAIESGNIRALNNLGVMLQHGAKGVARNAVEAEKLYREAIEVGSVPAMNNLGFLLQHGAEGVAQDAVGAEKLYRQAIEDGYVAAMYNLGVMLTNGAEGVARDAVEAEKLFRRAIEGGSMPAMNNLGLMLQHGTEGVAQDAVEAEKLYRQAIESGNVVAMNNLGVMLQNGAEGVARDAVMALKLYRRAIQGGDVLAMTNLGYMLQNGAEGVAQDAVLAEKLYREAIQGGGLQAMNNLGYMLQHGAEGVVQNAVKARKLYRQAIEGGNTQAMYNLGLMLTNGAAGVARDAVEAEKLYRRAINGGNVLAMNNLGFLLQQGAEGVERDAVLAAKLYRGATERGNIPAMNNLGFLLQHGAKGVAKDAVEAERLYRRAIKGGNVYAMNNLGLMLTNGAEGVARDAVEAEKLYRRAIESGMTQAMYNLGFMLQQGAKGVKQDPVEAEKLYRQAIEAGDVQAMFNLGLMLENGAKGVRQDPVEAEKLYREAVEAGNVDAMYTLGVMLENGAEGVGQDPVGAGKLYRRAIEGGSVPAMNNLGLLLQHGAKGVAQNAVEAEKLYRRAIESGSVHAMYNLGLMLQDGEYGVAQDVVEAQKLYYRAIDYGNVDAMYSLAVLL